MTIRNINPVFGDSSVTFSDVAEMAAAITACGYSVPEDGLVENRDFEALKDFEISEDLAAKINRVSWGDIEDYYPEDDLEEKRADWESNSESWDSEVAQLVASTSIVEATKHLREMSRIEHLWGDDPSSRQVRKLIYSEPTALLVTIETMPDCHRGSHRAAGNWGEYPVNGAVRRRVPRAEAEEIVEADSDGYDHILE